MQYTVDPQRLHAINCKNFVSASKLQTFMAANIFRSVISSIKAGTFTNSLSRENIQKLQRMLLSIGLSCISIDNSSSLITPRTQSFNFSFNKLMQL